MKRVLPILGEAPIVYYIMLIGARLGCIPSEDDSKGCLSVPGDAPFVYYMMFFGAMLGCIPFGDE